MKNSADNILKYFFFFFLFSRKQDLTFQKKQDLTFHTVSSGDSLHEMSNPIFSKKKEKKNITNLSSAELAQRVVKVNKEQFI